MHSKLPLGALRSAALVLALTLAACGPSAEPPVPTRAPAPTFTPTPDAPAAPVDPGAAATAQAAADAAAQAAQPPAEQPAAEAPVAEAPPTETPAPPTPAPAAEVTIGSPMNVRGGPGTNYNIVGAAAVGERYPITGKNDAGDWWQIDFQGQTGWVYGELVTAQNTESVAVAGNIPAPPPPTAAPVVQQPAPQEPAPQPAQPEPEQPAPAPAPSTSYQFNKAILQRCDPNAGVTYVKGTTYRNGSPTNGLLVAFSYAPDGPVVASVQSGPHQGYEGWDAGYYSHILQSDGPREGNWFFWIVDANGQRISAVANVQTDGTAGDGKCQQAIIDFDS